MESSLMETTSVIPHPLENHLVLEQILDLLQPTATLNDCKKLREVCKTWYFQTLSKWRTASYLNLNLGPPLNSNQPVKKKAVSANEYLALIDNQDDFTQLTEKPFQKFKLKNLELDLTNLEKDRRFWTLVGPQIKYLTLHEVNFKTGTQTVSEVMQFLVDKIPNLEHLNLNSVLIDGKRVGQPPRKMDVVHTNVKSISLTNVFAFPFSSFPNLEEASIEYFGYQDLINLVDPNATTPSGPEPGALITNSTIKRLNFINCNMNTINGMPRNFLNLRFTSLEYLYVNRENQRYCDDDFAFLSVIVKNHNQSLQTMEYFSSLTKMPIINNFINVRLPALTELRAYGNVFKDLSFLQYTPNLKILHLDLYGFDKQKKMEEELEAGPSSGHRFLTKFDVIDMTIKTGRMKHIELPNLQYFQLNFELSQNSLQVLAGWMPNLKTLKSVFNKDTFPVVCTNWPKLEQLECLFGSSLLNENITGRFRGTSQDRRQALVDLNYLTRFRLQTECNRSHISDDAVTEGFLRLPKLTSVNICVSPELSQEGEILLRQHVPNVQVYRNYRSNPMHKNWQCCQDKQFKSLVFMFQVRRRRSSSSDSAEDNRFHQDCRTT